jgi:hypothetical protein
MMNGPCTSSRLSLSGLSCRLQRRTCKAATGAKAELTLHMESGEYEMFVEVDGEPYWLAPRHSEECIVRFVARGDWEITGLAEALVKLGRKIQPLVRERNKERKEIEKEMPPI